ncbi:MAG: hypothetical protein ACWGHO_00385 [Candidatus Moraniibacteriota bacterium]
MQNKKRKNFIIKILKIQTWITVLFVIAYLITLSLGTRETFFTDLYSKRQVASAVVSATIRIFGPPGKVAVSGNAFCDSNNESAIRLSWPLVTDATSYNIQRRGEELANELLDNFFVDTNVSARNSYLYKVIAKGPAGTSVSETTVVSAKKCALSEKSSINVSIFEGKNISQIKGTPNTKNKKPVFQGQTDIPFAVIETEVHSNNIVYGTTRANINGYWRWSLPVGISKGLHELYIKAVDPNDSDDGTSSYFVFKIVEEDVDKVKIDKITDIISSEENIIKDVQLKPEVQVEKPFDLNISVEDDANIEKVDIADEVYRGRDMKTTIGFGGALEKNSAIDVTYTLVDSDENVVMQYSKSTIVGENLTVEESIYPSLDLKLGKYKLVVSATVDGITISKESFVILRDLPLVKIGENSYLTYDDLVSNLSWLVIGSMSCLSFFSVASIREIYLYKRAKFHITEKVLKRKGFIN